MTNVKTDVCLNVVRFKGKDQFYIAQHLNRFNPTEDYNSLRDVCWRRSDNTPDFLLLVALDVWLVLLFDSFFFFKNTFAYGLHLRCYYGNTHSTAYVHKFQMAVL